MLSAFEMDQPNNNTTRILVVDDERLLADTLSAVLRIGGFEVRVVYKGEDAIAASSSYRPDIVLSDYFMPPGMNGIEACVRIKQILPACRIIMLSGHPLRQELAAYQNKGYSFLSLTKPVRPDRLLNILREEQIVSSNSGMHLRVLNVDDFEPHRYSLSRLLMHAGFEVSEAATGTEALTKAIALNPNLIVLDIQLPDRNGYDVCKELKRNPETAHICVIHITNFHNGSESVFRSKASGADEYIPFPVVPGTFIERVRQRLQLQHLNAWPPLQ